MLKAIWPSLAHLHNDLSPGANITTAGASLLLVDISEGSLRNIVRHHVLLPILADTPPVHVCLPTEDSLPVPVQSHSRPSRMDRDTHLVIHQSPVK